MSAPAIAELRDQIVEALYPISATQLPAVCNRIGLESGAVEEALRSKRSYVRARTDKLNRGELLAVAREVLAERWHYELDEIVSKFDEDSALKVSEITRRRICCSLNDFSLSGRISLLDFIRDLWPVDAMSPDPETMTILAHRVHRNCIENDYWSNDELLQHLGVYHCSQKRFFALLEAVTHPRTRDETEQRKIIATLNPFLRRDGFALVESGRVSGYAVFRIRKVEAAYDQPPDSPISEMLAAFDRESVHAAWLEALDRRRTNPEGAITLARTLLGSVCKHIIEDAGGAYGQQDDLPKLYRSAATHLNLAPDQHTEEVFRAILGSCQQIVNGLGTLRNRLSDSHGKGRKPVRPQIRHAELAVNLAGTIAAFLVSTWQARAEAGATGPSKKDTA